MASETAAIMAGETGTHPQNSSDAAGSVLPINGGDHPTVDVAQNTNGAANNLAAKEASAAANGAGGAADAAAPSVANDNSQNSEAGNKTPTPTNEDSIDANVDTPASTPRRRIKKRRHDDFFYAQDAKAKKPASVSKPQEPTSAAEPKKARKRPRRCPAKDSILIEVPMSVTADMGVAMKRTRKKRIERIKKWVTSGVPAAKSLKGAASPSPKNGSANGKEGSSEKSTGAGEEGGYDDLDGLGDPLESRQYGAVHGQESVLDYLEAKYVRGVMIDDYDEKAKSKGKKSAADGGESDDSDGKGSTYDSNDDWIDDSLLHEEVAGQVLASSAYGMTQIEEEARKRKEERKKEKNAEAGEGGDGKPSDALEGLDIAEEEDKSVGSAGADSDFDDGFFVNLGDLEMAEGWTEEHDLGVSPAKKKKKKRAYNKKSTTAAGKEKTVKKKGTKAKAAKPGEKKKGTKKAKAKEDGKTSTKKKKAAADGKAAKKSEDKDAPKKKKKKAVASVLETATTPKKEGADAAAGEKTPKKSSAKKTVADSSDKEARTPKKTASGKEADGTKSVTPKKKTPVSSEKGKASQLHKLWKRRYTACMKQIKEMTSAELPRKARNKNMKVSVNIPPGKTIGDEIMFNHPSIPGQKCKVKIPKKADLENLCFVVSVPAPKVKDPEVKENSFPKAFKQALCNYAIAYDDWCVAEGEHNESLLPDQQKEFKPTKEKQKKFDEMINEFPKNLATPIDVNYLRKIARQERSNALRKEKRKQGIAAAVAVEVKQEDSTIFIPQKGTEFGTIVFNKQDFQEK